MTFIEKLLYLKKKVPYYTTASYKWLLSKLKSPDNKFQRTPLSDLKVGSFYFIKYDLSAINKSSKMEQTVPMLLVDYKPMIDNRVLYIMNLNFVPLNLKEAFFTKFLDSNYSTILQNNEKKKTVREESPLPNMDYEFMWSQLLKLGIEYSLREIRTELIKDIFKISTDDLHLLTTINTQMLTGLDEKKLIDIWIAKLKKESLETRVDEMLKKADYEEILNDLKKTFKDLNDMMDKI